MMAGWHVFTKEDDGSEAVSTDLRSEHNAIDFACDLIEAGIAVARIAGPGSEIEADAVVVLCVKHRRRPAREWPGLPVAQGS